MPTALVTGPTAGIGRALAHGLAGRGHDLVLVPRDESRLADLSDELGTRYGVKCETLAADLADQVALGRVESRIADGDPPVDVLVNNAGIRLGTGLLRSTVEQEQALLDVHVRAVLRLTKVALPGMLERRTGWVLNVSSIAGFAPYGTYGAAKAWVTSFTEGLASDLAGTGVRAYVVCPGYTRTEFHGRAGVRIVGVPEWMWLTADEVAATTLRHIDARRAMPVVIPSMHWRVVSVAARHAPRRLVSAVSRHMRVRRTHHTHR